MTHELPYPKREFKSARDWHIYHVYNDPDFRAELVKLDPYSDSKAEYDRLAKEYAITSQDVFFCRTRDIIYLDKNETKKWQLVPDFENLKMVLTYDLDITRAEFLEAWEAFEHVRTFTGIKPTARRRPPIYTELLYAVFRQRQENTSFKEIYRMFSEGTLPRFKTKSLESLPFESEESLERYYQKNKPVT